jgi:hypothetical protein
MGISLLIEYKQPKALPVLAVITEFLASRTLKIRVKGHIFFREFLSMP